MAMKKTTIRTILISIIVIANLAGAYFTHLVILNIKSYNTLGVQASGNANWPPVFFSLALVVGLIAAYKYLNNHSATRN
jgi:hypothetical protein